MKGLLGTAENRLPIGPVHIPVSGAPFRARNVFFANPGLNPGLSYLGPSGRMTGAKHLPLKKTNCRMHNFTATLSPIKHGGIISHKCKKDMYCHKYMKQMHITNQASG
jgi:hypothetical protein